MINRLAPLPDFLVSRYRIWKSSSFINSEDHFKNLASLGQNPSSMVISCCDSRVHATSIFGADEGEFFIHRNIANLVPKYSTDGESNGTSAAIEYALKELKIKNLVVGTPYLDEINTKEAEFLNNKGFSILNIQGLNLTKGVEFGTVTPEYWIKFAQEINDEKADAIFLSCGGIRSTEVIDQIEQKVGKPVITSNQAQMWSCLRRAGVEDKILRFGELFNHQLTIT